MFGSKPILVLIKNVIFVLNLFLITLKISIEDIWGENYLVNYFVLNFECNVSYHVLLA